MVAWHGTEDSPAVSELPRVVVHKVAREADNMGSNRDMVEILLPAFHQSIVEEVAVDMNRDMARELPHH